MIRGFFDVDYLVPIPKVWIGLVLAHRSGGFVPVDFVVDTGAAATCLHPADAVRRAGFTPDDFATLSRVARTDRAMSGITGAASYFVVGRPTAARRRDPYQPTYSR